MPLASDPPDSVGCHRGRALTPIPNEVHDVEILHRRVHPAFVRPDGLASSQAFRDEFMSVDRALFRPVDATLAGHKGYGVVGLLTATARNLDQEVVAAAERSNPAHALVKGKKTKSIAKKLARSATWVVASQGRQSVRNPPSP